LDCNAGGSDAGGLARWIVMQVVRFGGSDAGGLVRWIVMQVVLMQGVWVVGL
jgi:TRAP-type mannitol/chloroaromatic compound transport system permease small subunit